MIGHKELWSAKLPDKLKNSLFSQLSLPTNLTAQAFLIAHLPPSNLAGGVVWCLPSHRDLSQAKKLADFWFSVFADILPNKPLIYTFPQDFTAWLTLDKKERLILLLVAQEHLNLALSSADEIKQNTIELKVNEVIKPSQVLNKLLAAGFEPGPLPDRPGWYQKHGGTLIISTADDSWRLIWNGDTLEKIEELVLESGLAKQVLSVVKILPHNLAPKSTSSLANFISPDHTLIGLPENFLPGHQRQLTIRPTATNKLFNPVPLFAKQWLEFSRWLQTKNTEEKVILLSAAPYRLLKNLPADIPLPAMVEITAGAAECLTGFTDKASQTHYLTDHELYGSSRKFYRRSLASYAKLRTGDYLVHIDHGIGRFGGLTEKIQDGNPREYFLIEYAASDKLFVPIEHTDRLSHYLGSPHPPLERLSSAHWFGVQKKVKAETAILARELLNLYAKRHLAQIKPWQSFPEEELIASTFAYPLTPDQLKTWAEIGADLSGHQPMDRLICGDVGFGKTELAIRASARAVFNGCQVAVLAPTTILAQQHFDTFSARLSSYGIKIGLVSRAQTTSSIKQTLAALTSGKIDLIIGTHRLLTDDVKFNHLGLLIIDEEQRFGVKQKEKLRALKPSVHVLALSATPIPRTLNLAVSSLRDLSIILSPPVGRQAVKMIFSSRHEDIIKQAISHELDRYGQIFYLVPRVKDLPAAASVLKNIFPKLKIGIVHGQKSPQQVAATMRAFDNGELELLLATSIIENGLDLPNVNTLIVENTQKFGLADLYQLKGRVGRGLVQAYAYFLTTSKPTAVSEKRLEALAQTEELGGGLSLALRDLELRGAGAILGYQQHGQVSAVGLHLYGQMLADAIAEQRSGQQLPNIPEVRLTLPLEGRILPELVPAEEARINLYQRLASIREPSELLSTAQELIGRPLNEDKTDRLFKNLLTLLEIKLLAEVARLQEVTCWHQEQQGKFSIRFLETPAPELIERLTEFDDNWHKVESTWQAEHPLAAGAWIPWLKQSLKLLQN